MQLSVAFLNAENCYPYYFLVYRHTNHRDIRFQVKVALSWRFQLRLVIFLARVKNLVSKLKWKSHKQPCEIPSTLSMSHEPQPNENSNCPSAYGSLGTTNQLSGRCFIGNCSNLSFARFLINRTAQDKELSSKSSKVVRLVVAKAHKANWAYNKKGQNMVWRQKGSWYLLGSRRFVLRVIYK